MIHTRSIGMAGGLAAAVLFFCIAAVSAHGEPEPRSVKPDDSKAAADRPFGIEKRVPWSNSKFRGSPDPPLPYRAERVFPQIHFKEPTVLTSAPGTERMFVAEQSGK